MKNNSLPKHIAIIMDGNGRWAKKQGAKRIFGHQNAVKAVREAVEGSAELGIRYLTLYAFSTENWERPQEEVNFLMNLLIKTIKNEMSTLMKNDIKLSAIGAIEDLNQKTRLELQSAIKETETNKKMKLILALNYSGRWDIINATNKAIAMGESVDYESFEKLLSTSSIPDPELLIRTSGEMRISNFLLWQLAYTELYITEVLWPDFRKKHLLEAIDSYKMRERRFGKISEQINS